MMTYTMKRHSNGTITIKVGRTSTLLATSGEANAFIAGAKIAHLQLQEQIMPILQVKDGIHD